MTGNAGAADVAWASRAQSAAHARLAAMTNEMPRAFLIAGFSVDLPARPTVTIRQILRHHPAQARGARNNV
jgi:hypothetical protein